MTTLVNLARQRAKKLYDWIDKLPENQKYIGTASSGIPPHLLVPIIDILAYIITLDVARGSQVAPLLWVSLVSDTMNRIKIRVDYLVKCVADNVYPQEWVY